LNQEQWISAPTVHAVVSNFQPYENDERWWQVWKLLRNPRDRFLDWGAEAIFKDNNDLVVDTDSMKLLCGKAIDRTRICDHGDSETSASLQLFPPGQDPQAADGGVEAVNLRPARSSRS
jgi:hypothetical protein